MRHLFKLLTASSLMLSACAPGGIGEGFSTLSPNVVTTYSPPQTSTYKEEKYEVTHGATKINNLATTYDSQTHLMSLTGEITLSPTSNRGTLHIPVNLSGTSTSDGYVYLESWNPTQKIPGLKVGAKATCIGDNFNCSTSFIDIYLELDGKIYHHQVESMPAEGSSDKGEVKEPGHDDKGVSTPEDEIYEESEPEEEQTTGRYVGTLDNDIENILKKDEKKSETPKKDEPKKEQPKKDEPKKEEPKKETPKKDEPKKEEPTKEAPKKDDTKEEPKKTPAPALPNNKKIQAIGTPFTDPQTKKEGRLQNAINILELEKQNEQAGFKVLRPERLTHFATSEMAYLIALMGKFANEKVGGLKVTVGDVSREKGGIWYRSGKAWGHQSHQNGLDADIPFFFNNKSFQGYFASALAVNKLHPNWMKEEQWDMFKMLVETKYVDRIFIHGTLKKALCELAIKKGELVKGRDSLASETLRRLRPDTQHHNHFHIRAKCGKDQTLCKQMIDPAKDTGCF